MRKIAVVISLLFFTSSTFAQKLTYSDLLKLSTQTTDQSAELLISKGFYLDFANDNYYDVISFRSFLFKSGDDENIGVDFHKFKNGNEEIQSCYSKKFESDYKNLEAQVKIKLKKTRFFFCSGLNLYVTEYKIGAKYLYFTRGLCTSVKTDFKYGNFIITTKKYE